MFVLWNKQLRRRRSSEELMTAAAAAVHTAGCIFVTMWNLRAGRAPAR
jgi:hypothetical protein